MSLRSTAERTFSSLGNANYRKFFIGQSTSLVGTWMQMTAQSWLVLVLTHSATAIGVVVALQTLPVLVLGPYGGVIADRVDKRRFLIVLQLLMAVQAAVLGTLALRHDVTYLDVCVLAVVLGLNNSFENPSRQAFMLEMVGPDDLRNAVSLNSTMNNAARAVGPALAGVLIAAVGEGWCFVLNAVSFVAVVGSLVAMETSTLSPSPPAPRERGQLRAGLRYVARTPGLLFPLVMMGLVGTFAYEFQVTLPVVAASVFHGGSRVYGLLVTSMGVGAVVGGLVSATRGRVGIRPMMLASSIFGVVLVFASMAPLIALEFVALAMVGFASVSFLSMANSTLQLTSEPAMRGRVMALWAVAFMGSTPIGGPVIGLITSHWGARVGLGVGAVSCFVAASIGLAVLRRANTSLNDSVRPNAR